MSQGFRNRPAWPRSKALAAAIDRRTDSAPLTRDFDRRDQMRRAAVRVCSNPAEGGARQTGKESVQFLFMAQGSPAELSAPLDVAREVHPLGQAAIARLTEGCGAVAAMIRGLSKHRQA